MPVFFLVLFLFFVIGIFRKLSFRNRYFCLLIVNIFRHSAFVTLRFPLLNCDKYLHSNSRPVISVSDALQRLAMIDMASPHHPVRPNCPFVCDVVSLSTLAMVTLSHQCHLTGLSHRIFSSRIHRYFDMRLAV